MRHAVTLLHRWFGLGAALFLFIAGVSGAGTHQSRIELLSRHRERIAERQRTLTEASDALEAKISHYEDLVSRGLDCNGTPIDEQGQERQ